MATCRECKGTGKVTIETRYTIEERTCYICRGRGSLIPCSQCSVVSIFGDVLYPFGQGQVDGGKCPGGDDIDGAKCEACDDHGIATYSRSLPHGQVATWRQLHTLCKNGRRPKDCPQCNGRGYIPG